MVPSTCRSRSKYDPNAVVEKGPYELARGLAPETNATSFGQRLRWAKGAFQIFMAQLKFIDSDGMVDSEWANNHPKYNPHSRYMTKVRERLRRFGPSFRLCLFVVHPCGAGWALLPFPWPC